MFHSLASQKRYCRDHQPREYFFFFKRRLGNCNGLKATTKLIFKFILNFRMSTIQAPKKKTQWPKLGMSTAMATGSIKLRLNED